MTLAKMLHRFLCLAAPAGVLFSSTALARAQLQLIVIEKPIVAQSLSGIVVDLNGDPIAGATVEECKLPFVPVEVKNAEGQPTGEVFKGDCTRERKNVIASKVTNLNGRFAFHSVRITGTHYLYVRAAGFDYMEITVKLKLFTRGRLRIQLPVAT